MRHKILIFFFTILPKSLISRIFGRFAMISFPVSIMRLVIRCYCRMYRVNQDEILYPSGGFKCMDQFFTRELKSGIHKIESIKNSIVSPVDAHISEFGRITGDRIIQAKGIEYTVGDLIPSKTAGRFLGGSFITLYLSPSDYHRIHSPADGKISGYYNIPGKLFPVMEAMVNGVSRLFTKNERILSYIKTGRGTVAVCKVGAMNVGKITLSYASEETNKAGRRRREFFYPTGKEPAVKKGEEIGIFHLGSTVILLFQKGMIKFEKIKTGQKIRVGQKIASLI